ncbi:hemicentin-1-like isoform X2 [Corticium candelabrum]|uniref:hemicentin-1-like isoform X2 n=1 Tax=Corticium candelabrum TaxID=121492 RepID=UPI002E268E00|nr:hemicentin-1-like isoform X2 [Corticium candelabrum]
MFTSASETIFKLLIVLYGLQHIEGCALKCLNGGTLLGSCKRCKCAPQWTGDNCTEPCGGIVSSLTGHVESYGFPMYHRNNENCSWIVDASSNSTVILSFKSLNLENGFDFVYVYKGKTTDSQLVGAYTGNEAPYEAIVESPFLIVFLTDRFVVKKGFSLYWKTYRGLIPRFMDGNHFHKTVAKDSKVNLMCNAIAVPEPKIVWRKDGTVIAASKITKDGNELVLYRVNEADAGWYTCEAGNYLGTTQRSFQLTVHVFPVIIENPASISFNYFVNGNLQAAFWCKAYGIPEPTINWKKNGVLIQRTKASFINTNRWLIISRVTYADLGSYSCHATNLLGQADSLHATLSAVRHADHTFSFELLKFEHTPTVVIYRPSYMYLRYNGSNSSLDFRVYRNGIHVNPSTNRRFTSSYSKNHFLLNMSFVTTAYEGIYELRSVVSKISFFTVMDVLVPPTTFIMTKKDDLTTFYVPTTISCYSEMAHPKPMFTWYKNGVAINNTWVGHKIYQDNMNSYLMVNYKGTDQNANEYNCRASNVAGSSNAWYRLTVPVIDGWIKINRGSNCNASCGSQYSTTLVQKKCVISGVRCDGPSIYLEACQPNTDCSTNDTSGDATSSDENVIATGRTLDSGNSESSPMPSQKSVLNTSGYATSSDENVIATGRTLDSRNSESSPMSSQKPVLSSDSGQGMSTGVIIAVSAVAAAIFTALTCAVVFFFVQRRSKQKQDIYVNAIELPKIEQMEENKSYVRKHCLSERPEAIYTEPDLNDH